jgi:hypothetical protein
MLPQAQATHAGEIYFSPLFFFINLQPQYYILNNNLFVMLSVALLHPQIVLNFKLGNSAGQLQQELEVLFTHEYDPHPENVSTFFLLNFLAAHLKIAPHRSLGP